MPLGESVLAHRWRTYHLIFGRAAVPVTQTNKRKQLINCNGMDNSMC